MSTELNGKIKEKLWVRPECTDDSEPFRKGQRARADFKKHCREEGAIDVAAPDVVAEAFEGEDPLAEDRYD